MNTLLQVDDIEEEGLPYLGWCEPDSCAWLPLHVGALPVPVDHCVICGHPRSAHNLDDTEEGESSA